MALLYSVYFRYKHNIEFSVEDLQKKLPSCKIIKLEKGKKVSPKSSRKSKINQVMINGIIKRDEKYDESKLESCICKIFEVIDKNDRNLKKYFWISDVLLDEKLHIDISRRLLKLLATYGFHVSLTDVYV